MIKKKLLTLIILSGLLFTSVVYAQSSSSAELNEAQTLKEKIASKVAELQQKDQRAVSGTITAISDTAIKIKNVEEIIYTAKLDKDLTKIFIIADGDKSEAQITDLKKGDYIIVSGPIDNRSITANSIYKDEQFFIGSGKISEINLSDFYIKALTTEKDTYTLDLETFSKKFMLNTKTLEIEATTLAKIKEGDTIHFVYQKTGEEREKNRYSVQKILIIPQEYFIK